MPVDEQKRLIDSLGDWCVSQFDEEYAPYRDQFTKDWMGIYYRFLGKYREGELPKERWRSRVYVKLTKVKVLASWAQMTRALVAMSQPIDTEALDGNKDAAAAMKAEINNQLEACNFMDVLKVGCLEMGLYGNMSIQAPCLEMKTNGKWTASSPVPAMAAKILPPALMKELTRWKWQEESELSPRVYNRNIFECFPYPYSATPQVGPGYFHSAIVDKHYLVDLLDKPGFDKQAIADLIKRGPDEVRATAEDSADDRLFARGYANSGRMGYDLKFYTGRVDTEVLKAADPGKYGDMEGYKELWVWVVRHSSGNKVIKVVPPPIQGNNRPWFTTSFERLPHEAMGIGVGENVSDMQDLLNGATRMYIDAKKMSMPQIAINSKLLAEKGTVRMQPFKVWEFNGAPSDAMQSFSFQDVSTGLLEMISLCERFADDISGQPKFSSGQDSGMYNKTAHGLSMLMNAQTQVLQGAIENIQTDIVDPIGKAFYNYNMQFNPNKAIKGNMRVSANGMSAMMEKDAVTQRMLQFLTFVLNPVALQNPYAVKLLRQIGSNMGIQDVDQVLPKRELVDAMANQTEEQMFASIQGLSVPPGAPSPEAMAPGMPQAHGAGPGAPPQVAARVPRQEIPA